MSNSSNIKILLICFLLSLINSAVLSTNKSSIPLLLLISFDGFRWDYPDIYHLPNFNSILKRGVRVKHIDNSFATVTFPSHFTIVTGLFEETHGIVANQIYDPILNSSATSDTMDDTKWWSQNPYSQPIWISNQLANDSFKRHSGVIDWPGASVPINNHFPARYLNYSPTRPFESALNQIFNWFNEPFDTRINFGVIYHPEPDFTGHFYGPISSKMNETLKICDNYVGKLLEIIDQDEYLKENLNVIITSDHGMHSIDEKHKIILENYIDKSLFSAYGARSFANIFVYNSKNIPQIYKNLSLIPNYEVYKKVDIPNEYHYKNNVRIGDILIIGKVGYELILPKNETYKDYLGDHGYDNRAESMHPIFYGFGPKFRQNFLAKPFRNVDIYPLMSYLLRLNQRVTNGSFDNVKHILIDFPQENSFNIFILIVVIIVIIMGIIFSIIAYRHSNQLIYIPTDNEPVKYQLLTMNEGSTNNLIVSDNSEEEQI